MLMPDKKTAAINVAGDNVIAVVDVASSQIMRKVPTGKFPCDPAGMSMVDQLPGARVIHGHGVLGPFGGVRVAAIRRVKWRSHGNLPVGTLRMIWLDATSTTAMTLSPATLIAAVFLSGMSISEWPVLVPGTRNRPGYGDVLRIDTNRLQFVVGKSYVQDEPTVGLLRDATGGGSSYQRACPAPGALVRALRDVGSVRGQPHRRHLTLALPPLIGSSGVYPLKEELLRALLWVLVAGSWATRSGLGRRGPEARGEPRVGARDRPRRLHIDGRRGADHRLEHAGGERFRLAPGGGNGLPLEEVIIPRQLRASHREGLRRFLRTGERLDGRRAAEVQALRRDGREFPVEISISALRGEGEEGDYVFNAFIRDISAAARATRLCARRRSASAAPSTMRVSGWRWSARTANGSERTKRSPTSPGIRCRSSPRWASADITHHDGDLGAVDRGLRSR